MNSMFPVWTLSSLILSYTLAFPIFSNSSRGSYLETFPNITEIKQHNVTRLMENMETIPAVKEANFIEIQQNRSSFNRPGPAGLTGSMQNGDEEAGNSARDAFGPGKK